MKVLKYSLFLCIISCLRFVTCVLNLTEGASCVTHGHNGTCVELFDCDTAALRHLYVEAGFDPITHKFAEMVETCSYKGDTPIVCCTDCASGKRYRNTAIGPAGFLKSIEGSLAQAKCYDYFKRLPYPCRGRGSVELRRSWNETLQCDEPIKTYFTLPAVGGRNAEKWEFPHVAMLGYGDDTESAQWLCAGAIISEKFILTAAHCSSTRALGSIKYAALGVLKRTDPKETWKIYNIKRIILHPEYQSPSTYHDIALLETETEISFGPGLLPACLDIGNVYRYIEVEAAGWGRLGYKQRVADNLQVVILSAFNETECSSAYPVHRHLLRGYDHQIQMCFGSHYDIIDTCDGDSGGPLQINDSKCLYDIIGVTSYGKDCGILGSPGIYTRVSHYVPWIESIVWPGETV